MRLSHYQRLVLENFLALQHREPSYRRAIKAQLAVWILLVAAGIAAWYVIKTWLISGGPEYVALGMVLGGVLSQMGSIRKFVQHWSLQKQVIDVEAVKRLLAEDHAGMLDGEPVPSPRPLPFGWRTAAAIGVLIAAAPLAADWGLTVYHDPTRNSAGQVKVYGTAWCGACKVLRAHLKERGVEFAEFDVDASTSAYYAWASTESRGVPVAVIDNKIVRGANLKRIDSVLQEAGFKLADVPARAVTTDPPMSPLKR